MARIDHIDLEGGKNGQSKPLWFVLLVTFVISGLLGMSVLAVVLLADDDCTSSDTSVQSTQPDSCADSPVLIVGAGAAGLGAARDLELRGCQVIVIEARDRIGGRAYTNDEYQFEIGAGWIHGTDGNPTTLLAEVLEEPTQWLGGDSAYLGPYDALWMIDYEGNNVTQEVFDEFWDVIDEIFADYEAIRDEWFDELYFKDSALAEIVEESATYQGLTEWEQHLVWWHLESIYDLDWAASLKQFGMESFPNDQYYYSDSEDSCLPNGYSALMAKLADGVDVRLNQEVSTIAYTDEGATVTTADGTVFEGSAVLCTVPLGVLKAGDITFDPPLPHAHTQVGRPPTIDPPPTTPDTTQSITNLDMGTLSKLVLVFDQAYWPEDQYVFSYMSNITGEWPYFINTLVEQRSEQIPALIFLMGGDTVILDEVHTSIEELTASALAIASKVIGVDLPQPVQALRTAWATDPYSKGAYSHPKPYSTDADMDQLSYQVGNTLFFAGEHTVHQVESTVHGAYTSGAREANKISALQWNVDAGITDDSLIEWSDDGHDDTAILWLPDMEVDSSHRRLMAQGGVAGRRGRGRGRSLLRSEGEL